MKCWYYCGNNCFLFLAVCILQWTSARDVRVHKMNARKMANRKWNKLNVRMNNGERPMNHLFFVMHWRWEQQCWMDDSEELIAANDSSSFISSFTFSLHLIRASFVYFLSFAFDSTTGESHLEIKWRCRSIEKVRQKMKDNSSANS